ncbi:hypothetical protein BDY24DRAFT_382289 [Mrakia frigida]|uniref:uncharacterized protein n=1 Tax=Mrakia frigida TaxID=29902 RepID=UPI003FCC1F13
MSEKLSIPSILSTSSSTIHPPFKLSRHMAIIFPSLLTVLLPWTLLDYVEHLSVLTPGREFWISLPGRTQTTLKPLPVLVWYILVHLLVKFPTTSYYYNSSPGFRWIATSPSLRSLAAPSSSAEAQPTSAGRWEWSSLGLPSDSHPLSKQESFLPFWWPHLIINFPFVFCWVAYISGSIGEPGDDSYMRFTYLVYGVSMACFPFIYYMARDGGALDIHGKKD